MQNYSQKQNQGLDPFLLGDKDTSFVITSLIDDRTGVAFTSVANFKTFIRSKIGSIFCNSSINSLTRNGFIDYNDTTGAIALSSNTWTTVPNNGLGAFTNKTYKPDNVSEFMDVSTGAIDVTEIDLGDTILIRNDYQINPNTNNALLEFRYTLGSAANAYTLEKIVGRLDSGSNQNYRFSLEPDLIYMGDSNTRNNPIFLQVKLSTNGTLNNAGSVIQLIKR